MGAHRRPNTLSFAGLTGYEYDSIRYVIVPVPYDSTASFHPGAREGPFKVLRASEELELYDPKLGVTPAEAGIATASDLELPLGNPVEAIRAIEDLCYQVIADRCIPILIGGEHTIAVGGAAAAKRAYREVAAVIFDAHLDLRDSYRGSRYSHACTARRVLEHADRVIIVGCREASYDEAEYAREEGKVEVIWRWDLLDGMEKLSEALSEAGEAIYLSFDLDALDPSVLPCVGCPSPDGLSFREAEHALACILRRCYVVAADFTELSCMLPHASCGMTVAKLVYRFIGMLESYSSAKGR